MRRTSIRALGLLLGFASASTAAADPRHHICDDLGTSFGFGISSFGVAGDWLNVAHDTYGVDWRFVYIYVVPNDSTRADQRSFIRAKVMAAHAVGAVPVLTFYELLQLGQRAGLSGSEPMVVEQSLQNASIMNTYFQDVAFVMDSVADLAPVIFHSEPDSWGFMIWAFGTEGNMDSTSVPVDVASSGFAEVSAFANNASGLGHALLALRDAHAPDIRMGWHASNFRAGMHPEISAGFYSGMGEWDVLITEAPHNEGDPTMWWLPWDETKVMTNLDWFSTLSRSAHLPILVWQSAIGTTDFHLLGNPTDLTMLERFANAGVAGVMFEHQGTGDPDMFRAFEDHALAAVPPTSSGAGGTAADMRDRLARYAPAPLTWPAGTPCASGAPGTDGGVVVPVDAGTTMMGRTDSGMRPMSDAGVARHVDGGMGTGTSSGGCGCRAVGAASPGDTLALELGVFAAIVLLRRRRAGPIGERLTHA